MVRVGVAALLWMVTLCSLPTAARAEVCACQGCCRPLVPPPDERAATEGPSEAELRAVLAGGATAAVAAYVLGIFVARGQEHPIATVDAIPIAGAVASAARNA